MKKSGSAPGWQRLLSRANADPFFLGSALAAYKATHGVDDDDLAQWLECSGESLHRLAFCRLPDREERLARDVEQIAEFAGCNPDRLVVVVREVAALSALRKKGEASRESLLMAARDRKKQADEEDDKR